MENERKKIYEEYLNEVEVHREESLCEAWIIILFMQCHKIKCMNLKWWYLHQKHVTNLSTLIANRKHRVIAVSTLSSRRFFFCQGIANLAPALSRHWNRECPKISCVYYCTFRKLSTISQILYYILKQCLD